MSLSPDELGDDHQAVSGEVHHSSDVEKEVGEQQNGSALEACTPAVDDPDETEEIGSPPFEDDLDEVPRAAQRNGYISFDDLSEPTPPESHQEVDGVGNELPLLVS